MVEKPSTSVEHQTCEATTRTRRNRRNPIEDSGELVECSGEYCSSCSASVVADCIAVCCCPCAIANLVILTFVKVPWMIGRRCLGLVKKKRRRMLSRKTKKKKKDEGVVVGVERNGNLRKEERVVVGNLSGCEEEEQEEEEEEEESENFCASYEAERVWLEMYQLGHLGFGRVSFSGVPEKIN